MGYDKDTWRARYAERSDLTTRLIHLTRPTEINGKKKHVHRVLFEILDSCTLKGSSTASGFIVGNTPAVCLQDAPLHAVGQNCWFEQKWRKENSRAKMRYTPTGIMLPKRYVYSQGGRPVIYESTSDAKKYLPANEWWRIVNFDLSDEKNIIDWSHEREWRVPGDLKFKLSDVTILLTNQGSLDTFIKLCDKTGKEFYKEVGGIVTMENIVF